MPMASISKQKTQPFKPPLRVVSWVEVGNGVAKFG